MISLEDTRIKFPVVDRVVSDELLEASRSLKGSVSQYPVLSVKPLYSDVEVRNERRRRRRRILRKGKVPLRWELPGMGLVGVLCGIFSSVIKGCLNFGSHPGGKVYVEHHSSHCNNPRCPNCGGSRYVGGKLVAGAWIKREAVRAAERIMFFAKLHSSFPAKHIIVSPPRGMWDMFLNSSGFMRGKEKANKVAKSCGIVGGNLVFHPFRDDKTTFEPHFHGLMFGYVSGVKEVSHVSGWVIKNLGVRRTPKQIIGTMKYELSHCGISQLYEGQSMFHVVTWFGCVSYNANLKVPRCRHVCPHCGAELTWIRWWGLGDHPCAGLVEGEYDLDPGGWDYAVGSVFLGDCK